ncbi:hypothetical protein GJAV_G00259040 [Gymnothorax javanicus]|nr:hypothetical protein GJAV_G00259040 [Gymnothorax javanicus]
MFLLAVKFVPESSCGLICSDVFQPTEAGGAVCKMNLPGEPDAEDGAPSCDINWYKVQVERAGSPVPCCQSMKSEVSMELPIKFGGDYRAEERVQVQRAGSPVPNCQSMKSEASMELPIMFGGDYRAEERVEVQRAGSPVPSYQSMKSEASMVLPIMFEGDFRAEERVQVQRAGSPVPSCQSMKSEASMVLPIMFGGDYRAKERVQVQRAGSPVPNCQSMKSEASMVHPIMFGGDCRAKERIQQSLLPTSLEEKSSETHFRDETLLLCALMKMKKDEKLTLFLTHLTQDYPEHFKCLIEDTSALDEFIKMKELPESHHNYPGCTEREQEDPEVLHLVEKMLKAFGSERSLNITLQILGNMEQNNSLKRDEQLNKEAAQQALKSHLKQRFEYIFEGSAKQGHPTLLNEIYTELYITEGGSGGVNNEHEVRLIEMASRRQTSQETAIICNDIFKPLPGQEKHIRTVLTKGIAGIGKTVSVQKFILDWAEERANQDIDFIFSLPFRDLNLKKDKKFSLMQLLQLYCPQLKDIKSVEGDDVKVAFIFDGLDECRLPLNFQSNEICRDVTQSSSVDVLLTNLIQGNLLPSALLWITSRPAAANQIPPQCIHLVTEVRGFSDLQKEEYFGKRIRDENLASQVISHIKSSRSLYIMCHIPVFCWISATVLETMMSHAESGDLPKTVTEMYTHFLLIQTNVKNQKYQGVCRTNAEMPVSDTGILLKLGRLAFAQLQKGNLIFYEEDLKESGIDVWEASVYSGVCTEIFKEECGLDQKKVYCFVHLSIQEYLAALFVFHSCVNENRNVLGAEESGPHIDRVQLSELHRTAVDQALESKNGHLDLFLRFLLSLSLDSIQTLLRGILTQTGSSSLVPDPQTGSRSDGGRHKTNSLLTFFDRLWTLILISSPVPNSLITVFDRLWQWIRISLTVPNSQTESRSESIKITVQYIKKRIREELSAERTINLFHCLSELNDTALIKEIQNSLRSGKLSDEELEPHQCSALAFVLLMSEEVLDEFDSKTYNTSAAGHQRLVPVIRNCRKAILNSCDISAESCEIVASALQSSNSPLRDLDLSYSNLGDSGVKLLLAALMSPNCKLQSLWLGWCNLTEACCDALASVLRSPHSELRDLELRDNELQDLGVTALSAGLEDPHCKLQRLGLSGCGVTHTGCASLASALSSNPSHLIELDLRYNHPGDSGVKALSAAKADTLTLLLDYGGENRIKPGPRKYGCRLTLDPETANRQLSLSEGNRKVTHTPESEKAYPDNPERFESVPQIVCNGKGSYDSRKRSSGQLKRMKR